MLLPIYSGDMLLGYIIKVVHRARDIPETDAWRCSVKMLFREISQNSKENTGARVSFVKKLHY